MTPVLEALKTALTAMGVTADSPVMLDPEAERLASEEHLTEN